MKIAVVMPAWNESGGISEFLEELHESLNVHEPEYVVVDDCSTDGTSDRLDSLAGCGFPIQTLVNSGNRGHGPSTIRALRAGIRSGAEIVVAIDGDGQFLGSDVRRVTDFTIDNHYDVVEGVRVRRGDPLYRKGVSLLTRFLVYLRTGQLPRDANTPLRVYRAQVLARLLDHVSASSMTPNLLISVYSRRWSLNLGEVEVESRPRRGNDIQGSTWGKGLRALPTRRFIAFCFSATIDWFRATGPSGGKRS